MPSLRVFVVLVVRHNFHNLDLSFVIISFLYLISSNNPDFFNAGQSAI